MRIVIDMQGAQAARRAPALGRYGMGFARAIVRNRGPHDVFLALNGLFPETIIPIRRAFAGLLPRDRIRVWEAPGPPPAGSAGHEPCRRAALIREAFLASLDPDIVHLTGMPDGLVGGTPTRIGLLGAAFPVSLALHDPVPRAAAVDPPGEGPDGDILAARMREDPARADLLLAVSSFAAGEAATRLGVVRERIVTVSGGCAPVFAPGSMDTATRDDLCRRLNLPARFVLASGPLAPAAGLERLFRAFARLPAALRADRPIVLGPHGDFTSARDLTRIAARAGLGRRDLVLIGPVDDADLAALLRASDLVVVHGADEAGGLPALEAMACGAPTIGARAAGIPEVIGREDALFEATDLADMAGLLERSLGDGAFRDTLRDNAAERVRAFSWDRTARDALAAMERVAERHGGGPPAPRAAVATGRPRLAFVSPLPPDR